MEVTGSYLDCLRTNVKEAYSNATHKRLLLSGTRGIEDYENLRNAIVDTLKLKIGRTRWPPSDDVFINFFSTKTTVRIQRATIRLFEDFINAFDLKCVDEKYKTDSGNKSRIIDISGVSVINDKFKANIINTELDSTVTKYFLAKQDINCQWFGVFKRWDIERKDYQNIRNIVISSFDYHDSTIATVVHGAPGAGTSTLLRRLAVDFITSDIVVLWLNNADLFYGCIDSINSDSNKNYLLIIENWDEFNLSKYLLKEFISVKNIRIIIGDRQIKHKHYLDYYDAENAFYLSNDENRSIIKSIFQANQESEGLRERIFFESDLNRLSLYIVLFVIVKTYLNPRHKTFDSQNIFSQFKSIVRTELEIISKYSNGLALALYYWANLYKQKLPIRLSWQSFLKLADYLGNDTMCINHLWEFDLSNPIIEILSHYLSTEKLVHPEFDGIDRFTFHSDILTEKGLSQPIYREWYFNDKTKLTILDALIAIDEFGVASDFYRDLKRKKIAFKDKKQQKQYELKVGKIESYYYSVLLQDSLLKEYYSEATVNKNEEYWANCLWSLLIFFTKNNGKTFQTVLKTILKNGCKSALISSAYQMSKNKDPNLLFSFMVNYTKEHFGGDYKIRFKMNEGHVEFDFSSFINPLLANT